MKHTLFSLQLLLAAHVLHISAFSAGPNTLAFRRTALHSESSWGSNNFGGSSSSSSGGLVELKYKIHPGGRVEELVSGVKGGQCHKVTESVEAALGEVVATEPTEEMYENEVIVTQDATLSNSWDGSGDGSSFSSW